MVWCGIVVVMTLVRLLRMNGNSEFNASGKYRDRSGGGGDTCPSLRSTSEEEHWNCAEVASSATKNFSTLYPSSSGWPQEKDTEAEYSLSTALSSRE